MEVGSYGTITFEVSDFRVLTPSGISRESKARYAEHKVHAAKPRLEYLAPELVSMSMNIRLLASMGVNPHAEAEKLCAMAESGQVARLIILGRNYGYMILESVSQDWRHTSFLGVYSIDLALKLKEYV